jgi:hypothetical protein
MAIFMPLGAGSTGKLLSSPRVKDDDPAAPRLVATPLVALSSIISGEVTLITRCCSLLDRDRTGVVGLERFTGVFVPLPLPEEGGGGLLAKSTSKKGFKWFTVLTSMFRHRHEKSIEI